MVMLDPAAGGPPESFQYWTAKLAANPGSATNLVAATKLSPEIVTGCTTIGCRLDGNVFAITATVDPFTPWPLIEMLIVPGFVKVAGTRSMVRRHQEAEWLST